VPRQEVGEPSRRSAVAIRLGRALAGAEATARTAGVPARGLARALGRGLGASRRLVARGTRRAPAVWDAVRQVRPVHRAPTGSPPAPRAAGVPDPADGGTAGSGARIPPRRARVRPRLRVPGRARTTPIPGLTSRLAARVVHRPGRRRARSRSDEPSGPAA
jgi:hypothetical protein